MLIFTDIHYHRESRPVIRAAFSLLAMLFLLSGCAAGQPLALSYYVEPGDTPEQFSVCHGYGCRAKSTVILSAEEWLMVKQPLMDKAASPAEERAHIATAIATMEVLTGKQIGTGADLGGASFLGHSLYQMDCIDEAINTSLYLEFLEDEDLFEWHDVAGPARRGIFVDGEWPHNTAVVAEQATGDRYVIDTWFFDNGQEASIVPLQIWLDGWRPKKEE